VNLVLGSIEIDWWKKRVSFYGIRDITYKFSRMV
jgi:hypothetical protein